MQKRLFYVATRYGSAVVKTMLFCLMLFLTVTGTAHAQFHYEESDADAKQLAMQAYRILPNVFRPIQRKVRLRTLTQPEVNEVLLYGKGDATGSYRNWPKTGLFLEVNAMLTVANGRPFGDMLKTALHEFGHHIYKEELTPVYRQQWEELWQKEQRLCTLPTSYASANASEGFAECFACWILGPDKARPTSAQTPVSAAFHTYKLSRESQSFFFGVKQFISVKYGVPLPQSPPQPKRGKR